MPFRKTIAKIAAGSENSSDIVLSGNMKADLQNVIKRLSDEQETQYSTKARRQKLQEEWALRFVSSQMMLESGVPLSEHTFNGIKELQKLAQTKLNQFDVEDTDETTTHKSIGEQIVEAQTLLHQLDAVEATSRLRNAMALDTPEMVVSGMSSETLSREVQRVIHTAAALIDLKSNK